MPKLMSVLDNKGHLAKSLANMDDCQKLEGELKTCRVGNGMAHGIP